MAEVLDVVQTLEDRITLRDTVVQELNSQIFNMFSDRLNSAIKFYNGGNDNITWISIEKSKFVSGFVDILGYIIPNVGDIISIKDNKITIDEKNRFNYRTQVAFLLPINLLDTGSKVAIYNFIRDLSSLAQVTSYEQIVELLRQYDLDIMDDLYKMPQYDILMEKCTRPNEVLGFNTDELSEKQIKLIYMFSNYGGDKKH